MQLKTAKTVRRRRFLNKRTLQIAMKTLILMAAAVFLTWLLEYRHFLNDAGAAFEFIFNSPLVFWYSCIITFSILLLIYGIFRKPFMTVGMGTIGVLVIGYIHIAKFEFRGIPLVPEDFQLGSQAGTLMKFVDFWAVVRLVIAVTLVIVLAKILDHLTRKQLMQERVAASNTWWRRYKIASRVAIIAVAVAGFMTLTGFARHHTAEREQQLPFLSSKFTDWNQVMNYKDNGFLIGFLYNLNKLNIAAPDGYSAEKMAEIKAELSELAKPANAERTELATADYNIVLILNESFYDPTLISDYYQYTGGDITPNLHRLQQTKGVRSGTMYSIDYGGGTANIEYEVLTGLTNYWLKTVPYTNLIPKQKRVPSIANFAAENGFVATTLHPFNSGMYKRDAVLPKLGFSDFITEPEFSHTEKYGASEYINDGAAYAELIDFLKAHEENQLVSLITMQNHAPYDAGEYGGVEFPVTNIADAGEREPVETYFMTLHKSDEYLGKLYEAVQELDEKTIVLFYGDHAPGVFSRVIEDSDPAVSQLARQTPYLIFSNFELRADSNDGASGDVATLPTTTPNCLTSTLLNILNVKKPNVYYLLDTVCAEQPILAESYFGETAPFMSTALSEYNLLTYDLVAGKQYYL